MATAPQQFCVRWNSYHTNLQTVFPRLLLTEQFADVTLACESRQLRCHKLVLSACSAYLERLLVQNPCKHPIVLMKDMRFSEMQALVDFMYKGEVNVTQEELPSLLKSAEALQIRGLCSSDTNGLSDLMKPQDPKQFTAATDALVANAHKDSASHNGQNQQSSPQTSHKSSKKRKCSDPRPDIKEEAVEEDGLYYGDLDHHTVEYNEDEEPEKPGSSLGQTSDFAIANVQCEYEESGSCEDVTDGERDSSVTGHESIVTSHYDHTYDRSEPPAFFIQQFPLSNSSLGSSGAPHSQHHVEVCSEAVAITPTATDSVNVIRGQDRQYNAESCINKRIRRSEDVLLEAAACVKQGQTFQTVSAKFNIPISTIRFFMARRGILPKRRRGRHGNTQNPGAGSSEPTSPEPPYLMQHFRLSDITGGFNVHLDDDSNT